MAHLWSDVAAKLQVLVDWIYSFFISSQYPNMSNLFAPNLKSNLKSPNFTTYWNSFEYLFKILHNESELTETRFEIKCDFISLLTKLSSAVYCNQSCLWVCLYGCFCVRVCLSVCVSFTTITRNCFHWFSPNWFVNKGSDHLQLTEFWPSCAPHEGGLRQGENFWLRLATTSAQCLRLSPEHFLHLRLWWTANHSAEQYGIPKLSMLVCFMLCNRLRIDMLWTSDIAIHWWSWLCCHWFFIDNEMNRIARF